jgi:hypothetical protein
MGEKCRLPVAVSVLSSDFPTKSPKSERWRQSSAIEGSAGGGAGGTLGRGRAENDIQGGFSPFLPNKTVSAIGPHVFPAHDIRPIVRTLLVYSTRNRPPPHLPGIVISHFVMRGMGAEGTTEPRPLNISSSCTSRHRFPVLSTRGFVNSAPRGMRLFPRGENLLFRCHLLALFTPVAVALHPLLESLNPGGIFNEEPISRDSLKRFFKGSHNYTRDPTTGTLKVHYPSVPYHNVSSE